MAEKNDNTKCGGKSISIGCDMVVTESGSPMAVDPVATYHCIDRQGEANYWKWRAGNDRINKAKAEYAKVLAEEHIKLGGEWADIKKKK